MRLLIIGLFLICACKEKKKPDTTLMELKQIERRVDSIHDEMENERKYSNWEITMLDLILRQGKSVNKAYHEIDSLAFTIYGNAPWLNDHIHIRDSIRAAR